MNFNSREQVEMDTGKVISLFGNMSPEIIFRDPISELIKEALIDGEAPIDEIIAKPRKIVNENQFPDQSIYILREQLTNLGTSLNRIKFYLGDVDDLLPR